MDSGLKNKVALVTGAGSQVGFGRAIAVTLAKEGCDIIASDIDLAGAQKTAEEVKALGRRVLTVKADIASSADMNAMVKTVLAEFGRIDILVNNAGATTPPKLFIEKAEAEANRDVNLNFIGTMNCTRAVLGHMISRKSGKIINIASIGAFKGFAGMASYNASKAGVLGFARVLAVEVAPLGIIVNSIAPGMAITGFGGGAPPEVELKRSIANTPIRRLTVPQDIANVVLFLASDMSSDIVGQTIHVDGGLSIC